MSFTSVSLIYAVALALTACSLTPKVNERPQPDASAESICTSVSEVPVSECLALASFYNSTGGPDWLLKRGWLTTEQPCDWAGITCTSGHVTADTRWAA